MAKNETKIVKGMYNSSITRVRPLFQALFDKDMTGKTWLPTLLKAMPLNKELAETLSQKACVIVDENLQKRHYKDSVLGEIPLEECFEVSIPPSKGFLEWALRNPNVLTWPENGKMKFGAETQYNRECLFGFHDQESQEATKQKGIDLLDKMGVASSSKKWWSFEGFTEMDCLIETENYLLGFEGKRTEFVSFSTNWYQDRNQIVRNLEVLREIAREKGKEFAFILLTEEGVDPITKEHFKAGLPHEEGLVDELYAHYLGCLSWRDACKATGISPDVLPQDIKRMQNLGK